MDKKVNTVAGIALGASLVAAAGFAIYKYFRKKAGSTAGTGLTGTGGSHLTTPFGKFMGNSLIKSDKLYGSSALVRGGALA